MHWQYRHASFIVHQLPALRDNYIYLLQPIGKPSCIVIDPSDAAIVRAACRRLELHPSHIINTHHHWDHTDGNLALKRAFGCQVIGHAPDAARIPGIDVPVQAEEPIAIDGLEINVLDVPGHTTGHMALVCADALFPGDTLFGAGCGRIFEGSHAQMWHSLTRLAALPSDTKVYCAHEYTLANLRFARAIDPDNPAIQARLERDKEQRRQQQPTIPSTIAEERRTNPFLLPLESDFRRRYAQRHELADDALTVFRHIRQRKDRA